MRADLEAKSARMEVLLELDIQQHVRCLFQFQLMNALRSGSICLSRIENVFRKSWPPGARIMEIRS